MSPRLAALLFFAVAAVVREAGAQPPMPPETRPCIINLSVQEGWFIDTTHRSFLESAKVPRARAYRQAAAMVTERGWFVISADAAESTISAAPTEKARDNAKLEIRVSDLGAGSRVDVSFELSGDAHATQIFVREELCNLLEAAVSEE